MRAGNKVTLRWTMPKRNTDKTALKADVAARICRREGTDECIAIGTEQTIAPGKLGGYIDTLPSSLASGEPRPLRYSVELPNRRGRSAGPSNSATVLAGEAPRPIEGLKAEARKQGVVLSWTEDGKSTAVRLERTLLTPSSNARTGLRAPEAKGQPASSAKPPTSAAEKGLMAPPPEPINQSFIVDEGSKEGRAIDKTVRLHETYEYRAQRVTRVSINGETVELGRRELSPPVHVELKDVFPPKCTHGTCSRGHGR